MRVLIYGAGVIGCEMAHMLCKANQDVTLLARDGWREMIDRDGLVIRHFAQLRTTVDRVKTIGALAADDVYDLIFVVMQQGQPPEVLSAVAQNESRRVVLVGNNLRAAEAASALPSKAVAFGFQGTGGRRENGRVISVHAGVGMTAGGLHAPLDAQFSGLIRRAFEGSGYRLTEEINMDAWLKCHAAFILPIAYICYATDYRLPKATGKQLELAMDAALEGYAALRALGYPIRPADSEASFAQGRKKMKGLLWVMAKTPLGRLAASDHCKAAGAEMTALDADFQALRKKAGTSMPAWDALRADGRPRG